jgi:hypothetical protein
MVSGIPCRKDGHFSIASSAQAHEPIAFTPK